MIQLLILFQFLCTNLIFSKDWYSSPTGSLSNSGTINSPLASLKDIITSDLIKSYSNEGKTIVKNSNGKIVAGDRILLMEGYHGDSIYINRFYNEEWITIENNQGDEAKIAELRVYSSTKWRIKGLSISPEFKSNPYPLDYSYLVFIYSHPSYGIVSDVIIEDCLIYGTLDASGWGKIEWDRRDNPSTAKTLRGIQYGTDDFARRVIIRNNRLYNLNIGILIKQQEALVENNLIEGLSGDGINIYHNGNHVICRDNIIREFYFVNTDHLDAIQGYTQIPSGVGGEMLPLTNVTIVRNKIYAIWDVSRTDDMMGGKGGGNDVQGIGLFDGRYIDWRIEGNLIVTGDYIGIKIYGADDSFIMYNTIMDNGWRYERPEIGIYNAKSEDGGGACLRVVMSNNFSPFLDNFEGTNCVNSNNMIYPIEKEESYFVNHLSMDSIGRVLFANEIIISF